MTECFYITVKINNWAHISTTEQLQQLKRVKRDLTPQGSQYSGSISASQQEVPLFKPELSTSNLFDRLALCLWRD